MLLWSYPFHSKSNSSSDNTKVAFYYEFEITNYELYGSGDLHFGRLLHNRRFDIAMVAFLDCLKHLMDHIKSQDPSVDFPHQYVLSCSSKDDRLIADKGSQRIKSVMYPSNCSSIKKRLGLAHFVTYCWPLRFVSNGRPMVRTVDLVTGARSLYFDLPCAWSSSILICMKEGLTEHLPNLPKVMSS